MLYIDVFASEGVDKKLRLLSPIEEAARRSFNYISRWGNKIRLKTAGSIATADVDEKEIIVVLKTHVELPPEEIVEFSTQLNSLKGASYTILVEGT